MSRRTNQDVKILEDLVKRVVVEHQEKSPSKVMNIIKDEYGKNLSRNFVTKTLNNLEGIEKPKQEVEETSDLKLEYENHPEIMKINARIKILQSDFNNTDSVGERCKISGQIDSAQETKLKLKKILKETEMVAEKHQKIQYTVFFDGPKIAEKKNEGETKNE